MSGNDEIVHSHMSVVLVRSTVYSKTTIVSVKDNRPFTVLQTTVCGSRNVV